MLIELHIENFAIIHKLQIRFEQGLVVFTGETGAGKSIILDALEAVLGGRAEVADIRTGSERATIEASFQLDQVVQGPLNKLLAAEDLLDDPNTVVLSREIRQEGRNTARINGRMVTATLQREIGAYLVDIHGQSEHLSLLHVRNHRLLLDNFADVGEVLPEYQRVYQQFQAVRQQRNNLLQDEREAARRTEMLTYQIQEIEAANFKPGDEEMLRQDRTRLANAESLAKHSQDALILIEDGMLEAPGISELLGQVVESLHNLSRIDQSTIPFFEQAQGSLTSLQDLALELQDYAEQIEFNPRLLDRVEERIDLINRLKRKYGDSIQEILAFGQRAKDELNTIQHAEEMLQELAVEEEQLLQQLSQKGQTLSQKRKLAAIKLSELVEHELKDLRMAQAQFAVDIDVLSDDNGIPIADDQRVAFDRSGYDQVSFLVETNPGEGLKPLVKIASGGETSRLMLALKNVLVQADVVPTLIFDEIDQGIGGRVGFVVGEKLWQLSRQHQVMCITHLPQLAAFGDQHFKIMKVLVDHRTLTEALILNGVQRREELAQMLGALSEGTLSSADEMIQRVKQYKQTFPLQSGNQIQLQL
jgi:DNA repair protein RecN (Recombination protein N)